jgi:hypothetical protein
MLKELSSRVNAVEKKLNQILVVLKENNNLGKNNASIIDKNFQSLNEKVDVIDAKVSTLDEDTAENFTEVKYELVKIQRATQYEELNDNLNIISKK